MLIMVGPSVALNPSEIQMSSCEGEGFADGLLFDPYNYEDGYRVWEAFIEVSGLPFALSETGMVQYLGGPLDVDAERSFQYFIFRIDEFGDPIPGTYVGHSGSVHLDACVAACECEPNDPNDNIQIDTPTVIGQNIVSHWQPPNANGDWSVRIYVDGVKMSKWNGLYPIEVIAKELDENWVPTGFEISDCICG